jgi:thiamine-monophosphate kinase
VTTVNWWKESPLWLPIPILTNLDRTPGAVPAAARYLDRMSTPFHEFDWLRSLRAKTPASPRVPLGIGDDAALVEIGLQPDCGRGCLITTDMLMEGVDFLFADTPWTGPSLRRATPREAGRKALAVNISDIAAMGGTPVAAVCAVALPRRFNADWIDQLLEGVHDVAREQGVALAGGDTNRWDGPLVLSITLLGDPAPCGPITRGGARPGDWLLATGAFGGSLLGRHLAVQPRVREACELLAFGPVHALIDVSDGLSQDAGHLCDAAGLGLVLDADAIPIHADAHALARSSGRTPLEHALSDGEDFELLAAVPPEVAQTLPAVLASGTLLTRIGKFTAAGGLQLRASDGSVQPLPRRGWVHG